MASRVDGCRLTMPPQITLHKARLETVRMPGLGFMDSIQVIDEKTLGFSFVGTTERGELLARRMREGRCQLEAVVPKGMISGVTVRNLQLRVVFEEDDEDRRIIMPD